MIDFINELKVNLKLHKMIENVSKFDKPFSINSLEETFLQELNCFKDEAEEKQFFGLFSNLVDSFLKPYYKNKLFPSQKYIYDLFFYEIKKYKIPHTTVSGKHILENVTNNIEIYNLLENTLVIHPLADFGFQNIGSSLYFSKIITDFYFSFSGFVIFPQANSFNQALKNIKKAMRHFKLPVTRLSKELFEHYQKSRNTKWLIKNPIIIHQITQSYEGYYENQFFIVKQLERHLSLLYLIKCLSEHEKLSESKLFDTNRTNNFQTYDEYHYFILNKNGDKYEPLCIPRHFKLSRFFDTFKLNITIPINFNKKDKVKVLEISKFIDKIYSHLYSSTEKENYYIIRRSLGYFVRSYQAEYYADSILFLCIAFEMLLSEKKDDNISAHIANIILFLRNGNINDVKEFKNLYSSRSGVAHEGEPRECNIQYCRYLYFEIFYSIVKLEQKGFDISNKMYLSEYIKNICTSKLKFLPDIK